MSIACAIRFAVVLTTAAAGLAASPSAFAQEPQAPADEPQPPASESPAPAASAEPAPPPAPYSLPWQLRGAAAPTAIRSDTTFARYEDAKSNPGLTIASTFLASFKVPGTGAGWRGLAPLVRLAIVEDSPPVGQTGGFAFVNPLLGATYAVSVAEDVRASFFLGFTVPVGMGGGDTPDPAALDARNKGSAARMMMDNSLFAVNDLTVIPGADIAWVSSGVTLQAEITLFQLTRVRGENVQHEASKTNLTSGIHVGYSLFPLLSLGLDVRYQRWLDPPFSVEKDKTGTLIDNWSLAIGPRLHIPLGGGAKMDPGIAYSRYLDKPEAASTPNYHVLQLDIPVAF